MDLFTPQVAEEKFHGDFRLIYNSELFQPQRDVIQRWAKDFTDRDNKFVKEFQTTFNSSLWELYLFELFKEYKFEINLEYNRPDFLLKSGNNELVVEAVISNEPVGGKPENFFQGEKDVLSKIPVDFTDFNRLGMIRLANSICYKYKLYKKSYKNLPHVRNKPFVIALAPFHCPYHYFCADVPIRSVLYDYYVDEHEYQIHPEKYLEGRPPTKHLHSIQKDNGAELQLGLFTSNSMPEVSAIIYNPIATYGKLSALAELPSDSRYYFTTVQLEEGSEVLKVLVPKEKYKETIFSGLQIYHNPYADHPLDDSLFKNHEVTQCFGYHDTKDTLCYDHYDNILMARFVIRVEVNTNNSKS